MSIGSRTFKFVTICILAIVGLNTANANEIDLSKANEYLRKVDNTLVNSPKNYRILNGIHSELEKLNYKAEKCVQDETKQLGNIDAMEKQTGLNNEELNGSDEDVKYITKKKKKHALKLSQCRLFVFKSQDKIHELQVIMHDIHNSPSLSINEKIITLINDKQSALSTFAFLIIFMVSMYTGYWFFLREKITTLHLTRVNKLFEVKLLKFSLWILFGGWMIIFLSQWWDISSLALKKTQDFLVNGMVVYGVNIIPLRLLIAVLLFSIIQIIGKYIAMRVSNQAKFEDEAETQIVIDSLIKYVVFAIALMCAMLVTGVDFTGLAIVAGALSVGIGFGLQNIVNNFLSGLILLIEKPIRLGDRIMINGIEGYVADINIRTTRIISFLKEEIIIPNSDLISNPVTNFVLHNVLSKMTCRVSVTYDNDINLVMKTLLDIAEKHQDVLKDLENKPTVVLLELKEGSMVFELGCIVKHIDQKYHITSEINIMIVHAFKTNNVKMALPQLEVHNLS